jgi:hypothetical protein
MTFFLFRLITLVRNQMKSYFTLILPSISHYVAIEQATVLFEIEDNFKTN